MIRFIDIREQETGNQFAFWDTVKDEFIKINGNMAWNSLNDLKDACGSNMEFFLRCVRLSPDWLRDENKTANT